MAKSAPTKTPLQVESFDAQVRWHIIWGCHQTGPLDCCCGMALVARVARVARAWRVCHLLSVAMMGEAVCFGHVLQLGCVGDFSASHGEMKPTKRLCYQSKTAASCFHKSESNRVNQPFLSILLRLNHFTILLQQRSRTTLTI